MKKRFIVPFILLGLAAGISCSEQDPVNIQNVGNFTDAEGPLRELADFPMGIGIDYTPFLTDATYKDVVSAEADNVTFGYHMKHGAIVKGDGSLDFSNADELLNSVTSKGLSVFGHTLAWHQNQNGDYLRGLGSAPPTDQTNLYTSNGDFESGTTNFTGWNSLVGGTAQATYAVETSDIQQGTRTFKVTVTAAGANPWDVQTIGSNWTAETGKTYAVKFFAKSDSPTGIKLRVVNQNSAYAQQEYNVINTWTEYTWNFTPTETSPILRFNFLQAGMYLIDNIRIAEAAEAPPSGDEIVENVDNALKTFVQGMVNHYKDKVHAWDVVNEAISDAGTLRTGSNASTTGDTYYWAEHLGKDYIKKAFMYAAEADPTAKLFINDYNLESNPAKLDALLDLVEELRAEGVPIHGIGTQMHINIHTSYAGIDDAFQKLAETGLLIRVSELDVRANPLDKPNFDATQNPYALAYQAVMYNYVVESYKKNVPAAQQHGITVWGVTDTDSWIVTVQNKIDAPLLFDGSYGKKPAYSGMVQALKAQQ